MPPEGDEVAQDTTKIMFEVYREGGYDRRYRVVYFTELGEHDRDAELSRCLAGESFVAGYLDRASRSEARGIIARALERLNDGQEITPTDLRGELEPHLA